MRLTPDGHHDGTTGPLALRGHFGDALDDYDSARGRLSCNAGGHARALISLVSISLGRCRGRAGPGATSFTRPASLSLLYYILQALHENDIVSPPVTMTNASTFLLTFTTPRLAF